MAGRRSAAAEPLTPQDQSLLTHIFTGQGQPLTLALSCGMSLADFLAWHKRPEIIQAFADYQAIQDLTTAPVAAAARRTIIIELEEVVRTTTDPIEKRRAATTLLRAINPPRPPRPPKNPDPDKDTAKHDAASNHGGIPDREGGGTGVHPHARHDQSTTDHVSSVLSSSCPSCSSCSTPEQSPDNPAGVELPGPNPASSPLASSFSSSNSSSPRLLPSDSEISNLKSRIQFSSSSSSSPSSSPSSSDSSSRRSPRSLREAPDDLTAQVIALLNPDGNIDRAKLAVLAHQIDAEDDHDDDQDLDDQDDECDNSTDEPNQSTRSYESYVPDDEPQFDRPLLHTRAPAVTSDSS